MERRLSKAQKEALRFLLKGGYLTRKADVTLAILCERGLVSIKKPTTGLGHGYWISLTEFGHETAQAL